jgi:hypothetical protein
MDVCPSYKDKLQNASLVPVLRSMHNLPAYGLFCTECVHGKFPCPVCKEALRFIWLNKGGKYSLFDKH